MKTVTKVLAGVTVLIGIIAPAVTPVIAAWISTHPTVSAAIATVSTILALFHQPSAGA